MSKKKKHTVRYDARPQSKQRPRLGRRGRVYTPVKTQEAESVIRDGWNGPCFNGPVFMDVEFSAKGSLVTVGILDEDEYGKTALRGDIDNYLKLIMDGLNGVAYEDDSQIRLVTAKKI